MTTTTMGAPPAVGARATDELDERGVAELAMHGTPLERARLAARTLAKLLRDPDDTKQVLYVGLLVNRGSYPQFLARFTTDDEGARLLRERPAIDSRSIDFDALRALPPDTLGGAYVRFLDAHGLDPDLFQRPPGLPEIPAYISQRMRQVHDLWHVLTGYPTDVASEIALQAFTWAQTDMASAWLVTLAGIARWGVREPRVVPLAVDGFRRGRRARFLPPLRLEDHFARKLDDVRAELGIEPYRA